jgi:uncharacterized damage-inducible protein DinB
MSKRQIMSDERLREQVADLLVSSHAHVGLLDTLERVPARAWSRKKGSAPYSAWQLLEHIRIAQWDILEFTRNAAHVSPAWPEGYWPATDTPASPDAVARSVAAVRSDLDSMIALVRNPSVDLFARIPHGDGQTVLREALLVADHNSYHLGQLVLLLKESGTWPA